jgi:N4-gp56 family major capsid protein
MATNVTTSFTDTTSSDATQSIFNTLLLVRGTYALIHQLPVKKYNLNRRSGKTMIWRRYDALSLATVALQEGTNPAGRAKTKTDVAATIAPYGDFIEDSDMVIDTQPDPHTTENVELLGQQMGETFDALYRDLLADATNIVYANGTSTVTVTEIIDRNDLDRAYRLLRVNKARPFSPMIMAGQNIGTGPVMPSYWGLCDERMAFDIRHVDGFLLTSEYGSKNSGVLAGEFGADKNGIRFLSSPNGYWLPGATGVTATDVNGLKKTSTFVDVYSLFIVGMEAVGGVNLANGNGGIIRKGLGSAGTADALNMRATVGWKKFDARKILNQNFLVEVQAGVSL